MKGLPRSLAHASAIGSAVMRASLPVRALALAVVDGIPGFGTVALAGLPQGNLLFLGAVSYLQLTTADADVIATFDGDYSLGTTATADGTLSGTDADLVPSTALGAATAKVSPVVRGASTDALGGGVIDNTDGATNINLNVIIDDVSISGAADFVVEGVVHIAYIVLGDD